jgi:nicotinate-nucleotide adenylyltransferase
MKIIGLFFYPDDMNIAIFGGTFNPVHNVHCRIVQQFMQEYAPAQVHVVPCALSPFKQDHYKVADEHRVAMLALAFQDPRIMIDDRELRRGGISYTIDTIREIHTEYPQDGLYLIIGGDQAKRFGEWKEYQAIAELCTIVVAERPDYGGAEHLSMLFGMNAPYVTLAHELSDYSSTEIRQNIGENKDISGIVPAAVYSYIVHHNLYRQ